MLTITFQIEQGNSVVLTARPGETLSDTARRGGVRLDVPCGGNGTCGKCRVRLLAGTAETQPSAARTGTAEGWYLACRTYPRSDLTVLVPGTADAYRSGIKTADLSCETAHLFSEAFLRESDMPLSAFDTQQCGIAIDIGTTTVSAVLFSFADGRLLAQASCGNGQIRYGADVITRILSQGKPDGIAALQNAILHETLYPLLTALCKKAGVSPADIARVGIAANTTMAHFLLGVDAQCIRTEPYIPAFLRYDGLTAQTLSLPMWQDAQMRLAPGVGAYVGGDITAGMLACRLWDTDALTLFIDLGTNGEIVLGNREFQLACACSAGPAFEGGDISCGMRATDGAIEACSLVTGTLTPRLRVIGDKKPVGLCGSGLIDAVAALLAAGAIDARGRFVRENKRIRHDGSSCGSFVLATADESADGREITLTETDISSFIRAKGAIYAAVDCLLTSLDLRESAIERLLLAGGIGSGIDLRNAVAVGMLPNIPLDRCRYIGNSALAGAYLLTASDAAEQRLSEIARGMTYVELSAHPGYMEAFVAACFLPHTDASRFIPLA